MDKVLVTGANGHLGFTLTKLLVEKGYNVRASVRNLNDPSKIKHLQELKVELVEADLMKPEALRKAMDGVDGLFQVAAVYKLWAKKPDKEIIDPIVTGGMNALKAARDAEIKKVIFTSSTAAVGNEAPPDRALNENDWNQDPRLAYVYAKAEAEKKAWRFAEENALNMVVINPGAITGPGFYHHTPSTIILERALRGNLPGIPPYSFTYVDVRDVAELHLLAYENPNAKERYIAADRYLTLAELLELVREIDGKIRIPRMRLSQGALKIFSVFDWLNHTFFGNERQVTLESISEFANRKSWLSPERARKELGWQPRDFRQSLADTLDWIRKTFIEKS